MSLGRTCGRWWRRSRRSAWLVGRLDARPISHGKASPRGCSSTGYGLRFSAESMGAHRRKRFSTKTYRNIVLFLLSSSRNLRTSPEASGKLRGNVV